MTDQTKDYHQSYHLINQIREKQIPFPAADDYHTWVEIGFSFCDLGIDGLELFLAFSQLSTKYPGEEQVTRKFESLQKDYDGRIKISTFFHYCQQAGVDFDSEYYTVESNPELRFEGLRVVGNGKHHEVEESEEQVGLSRINDQLVDRMPPLIQSIVNQFSHEVEREVVCLSTIVSLSGIMPEVYFNYNRKRLYTNLYLYVLGPAGSGKAAMDNLMVPLRKIDEFYIDMLEIGEDEEEMEDPLRTLLIPSNISASGLIEFLDHNDSHGIIFETEADTITNNAMTEWGDILVVTRKAFSHESGKMYRRTGKELSVVNNPKLTILLSSTYDQFKRFIQDEKNGTFSRFMYYHIPRVPEIMSGLIGDDRKDVVTIEEIFETYGEAFLSIYKYYSTGEHHVFLTKKQDEILNKTLQHHKDMYYNIEGEIMDSTTHRMGIIICRIAVIFTICRTLDTKTNKIDENQFVIEVTNEDFILAVDIANILFDHSYYSYNTLARKRDNMQLEKAIVETKAKNPDWGAKKISDYLHFDFEDMHKKKVQRVLAKYGFKG